MILLFQRLTVFCLALCLLSSISLPKIDAQQSYTRFTNEQLRILMPSQSRIVRSLAGLWDKSTDDGSSWEQVTLPMSETKAGKTRFRRTIKIDKKQLYNYNWSLYSLGTNEDIELYLNGKYVGRYFAGMAPFSIRLPESKLLPGLNLIEMQITPPPAHASRHIFAQQSYSGIIREMLLIGSQHIAIEDVQQKTFFNDNLSSCQISTQLVIRSGAIERLGGEDMYGAISLKKIAFTVSAVLRRYGTDDIIASSAEKTIIIERDRTVNTALDFRITNPDLWTPSIPNLYEMSIKITHNGSVIDDYSVPLGLYRTKTANVNGVPRILLNNEPFTLKAVDYYEHMAGLGQTMTSAQIQKDVISLKTLGVNAIRIKSGNPHPYLVHQCNVNGIFILSDLPVYDYPAGLLEDEDFLVRITNIASRMANAYDRHPSIFGYGLSDGLQESSKLGKAFITKIGGLFRSASSKMLYKSIRFGSKTIDEQFSDILIARSSTRWEPGESQLKEILRLKTLAGNQPLIVHLGKPVQPNNLNGFSDPLSVESQAQYIRDGYRTSQKASIAGIIIWSFNDFITARAITITNPEDQQVSTSGLVDLNRQPRLSYAMFKALLNDEKEPLLRSGITNGDTPLIFILLSFSLGIAFFVLISKFRRLREYMLRALIRPYNFYSDIRDQRLLSLGQTLSVGLLSSATLAIVLSTMLFVFRSSFGTEYLYMILLPTGFLRTLLNEITWTPELGFFLFTLMGIMAHIMVAGIILFSAFITRTRLFFIDAFTISVWSALPFLLLLPIALALFKLLSATGSAMWLLLLMMGLFIWYFARMLKSTAVVFDIRGLYVYASGTTLFTIMIGIILAYYSSKVSLFHYLYYYFSTFS
jgi:beta-galactosidase